MPKSLSFLFKRSYEYVLKENVSQLPLRIRGIYVLYKKGKAQEMNVTYVGMARGERSGAKGRIGHHSATKADSWTHCSVYEVWDNITAAQVMELEGFVRHLYRRDSNANALNVQKGYTPLHKLAKATRAAAKVSSTL